MVSSGDFELIDRTLGGDSRAFDQLVLKYQDRAFCVAYRMLASYEEAKDVAQEAFVSIYRSLASFRKDASFSTYLYRVVVNLCKNRLRRLSRDPKMVYVDSPVETQDDEVSFEIPDNTQLPRDEFDKKDKQARMQEALNSLDDEHKAIVVMRDIEAMSYEDISAALEINMGTIKSRLHRARQMLKEKLKDVI